MITTLKLSLVGWLINLVKWKSIANESTAVWHFSIQFKLKSPTIIISQLLREGTLETWPPEQRNCKCREEWAESGAMMELLEMNSAWTAQPRQHRGWGGGVCKRCWSAVPYSWVQPCFSPLGRQEFLSSWSKSPRGLLQRESRVSHPDKRVGEEVDVTLSISNSPKFGWLILGQWMPHLFILNWVPSVCYSELIVFW